MRCSLGGRAAVLGAMLAALAISAIDARPARAADADPMTAEATARFKEGLELYKAHKPTEARAKYLQALALSPAASILLNLAVVEYDLTMYPEALGHAKAYLVHPSADPGRVDKLKKEMLPELVAKTAHVSVQGKPGEAVFVDGKKVGVAPLPDTVDVNPGDHTVACGSVVKNVNVRAGDNATVIVIIENGTPPAPSATTAPPPTASSAAPVASSAPIDHDDEKKERTTVGWAGPIALAVVGAGGIVTGIALAGSSNSAADDRKKIFDAAGGHPCADRTSATCSSYDSKGSDANGAATISVVGYCVGGASLAGAAVFWYLTSPDRGAKKTGSSQSVTVRPWFDPSGGGGATVGGRF